jgi:hypothetical protein
MYLSVLLKRVGQLYLSFTYRAMTAIQHIYSHFQLIEMKFHERYSNTTICYSIQFATIMTNTCNRDYETDEIYIFKWYRTAIRTTLYYNSPFYMPPEEMAEVV